MKTPGQVCANPPTEDADYDVSVSLPDLIGFPKEFIDDLKAVGGNSLSLATKLLQNHHSDGGKLLAGKLCENVEQWTYYNQTLDAGPMVSRWMKTCYELPFSSVPPKEMSAPNNKSLFTNLEFAQAEIG